MALLSNLCMNKPQEQSGKLSWEFFLQGFFILMEQCKPFQCALYAIYFYVIVNFGNLNVQGSINWSVLGLTGSKPTSHKGVSLRRSFKVQAALDIRTLPLNVILNFYHS
jgi:hypothetical protein